MNEHPIPPTLYEFIVFIGEYVKTHYYFYTGVLMRIFLDYDKWNLRQLVAYIIVSVLLVDATKKLFELNGSSAFITTFVCIVLGFVGNTPLRFFLDDFMKDVMFAIKDRIIRRIKK